jgi:hypothetical protein
MKSERACDDCLDSRRNFLTASAASIAALGTALPSVWAGTDSKPSAESYAGELFNALSSDQRKVLCFPVDHPLRKKVSANWNITEPNIESMPMKQQELVERIVKSLSSDDGAAKFKAQMEEDAGGLGDYHVAFFGKPGEKGFEFVLTGRHVTMRADGNFGGGPAFGGPMVYGHQSESDPEKPEHPGNVFWYQAKRANEVFKALDPNQRKEALCKKAPAESSITHRKDGHQGILVGSMSSDQKGLVKAVMSDLLSPYRKEDADEVMAVLTANGGLEKTKLAFYQTDEANKNADLGNDGVWDIWRLEGPGFVWHFRGAPHVHVWVNISRV